MSNSLPGYDAWKLSSPAYDTDPPCECGHPQEDHQGILDLIDNEVNIECLVDDCQCREYRPSDPPERPEKVWAD